jgi:4-amino-4-deoxychorismate lyase
MFQLVESIWLKDGELPLIDFHQKRFEETCINLYGACKHKPIFNYLDDMPVSGEFKCRFLYNANEVKVEYHPYTRSIISKIKAVEISKNIVYDYKYIGRPYLDIAFAERDDADEIIMIKNGCVTDAYYYNIVFEKEGEFYTSSTPLFRGVMRSYLLSINFINEIIIKEEDIFKYESIHLINALNPLGYHKIELCNFIKAIKCTNKN